MRNRDRRIRESIPAERRAGRNSSGDANNAAAVVVRIDDAVIESIAPLRHSHRVELRDGGLPCVPLRIEAQPLHGVRLRTSASMLDTGWILRVNVR
jgi:hypothetical protein